MLCVYISSTFYLPIILIVKYILYAFNLYYYQIRRKTMNKLPEINIAKLFVGRKFDSFSDLCTVLGIEKPTAKNTKEKIKKHFSQYFSWEKSNHARYGIIITEIYKEKIPLAKTTRKRSSKYGELILPIVLNSIEQSLDEGSAPCINASILNFFCEWGLVNADFVREKYKTYNLTKDEFKAFSDITYEFLDVVYDKIKNEVFERALNNLIKKGFKIHKHKWLIKKVDEPQARLSSTKEDIQIETLSNQIMEELEIENRNLRLAGNKRTEYDNLFKKVLYEKMSITSHAHRVSIEIDIESFEKLSFSILGKYTSEEKKQFVSKCKQELNKLIVKLILKQNNTLKENYLSGTLSHTNFQENRRSFIVLEARNKELESLEYNEKRFRGFISEEARYAESYKKERDKLVEKYIKI